MAKSKTYDLNEIYEYFKELRDNLDQEGFDKDHNPNKLADQFHLFLIKYLDKKGSPNIFDDRQFNNLEAKEYYHGFKSCEYGANYIMDRSYHAGFGVEGPGMYFTAFKNEAYNYTANTINNVVFKDAKKIISMKILSDKKVYKHHLEYLSECLNRGSWDLKTKPRTLSSMFNNPEEQEPTDEEKEIMDVLMRFVDKKWNENDMYYFLDSLCTNPTNLALLLGYDFVMVNNPRKNIDHAIALNRGAIALKKSQVVYQCNNSISYQNVSDEKQ